MTRERRGEFASAFQGLWQPLNIEISVLSICVLIDRFSSQTITLLAKHDTYGVSFEWDASDDSIERAPEPPVDSKWITDLNQMNTIYNSLKAMMAKNPLEYKRVG